MSWSCCGYGLGFVGPEILEPFWKLVRPSVGDAFERALLERWNHFVGFWNSEPSPSGEAERGTDADALRPSFGLVGRLAMLWDGILAGGNAHDGRCAYRGNRSFRFIPMSTYFSITNQVLTFARVVDAKINS